MKRFDCAHPYIKLADPRIVNRGERGSVRLPNWLFGVTAAAFVIAPPHGSCSTRPITCWKIRELNAQRCRAGNFVSSKLPREYPEHWATNLHHNFVMIGIEKRFSFILIACFGMAFASQATFAQDFAKLPDAPTPSVAVLPDDRGQSAKPAVDVTTGEPQREATWRSLPGDFLHDQKDLWTFPLRLAKGQHLVPTLIVLGGTVGLIYADPHAMPYFRNHQKSLDDFNDVFDPMITTGEVIALPAGLMAAGYIRHDDREVNTALLAAEAYGDSVVINLAMKAITRRQRPSDVAPNGDYSNTFFNGGKSPFKGSSFPSGHATAVWSVATVVAERYRHRGKPWIPVLAYTLATAISCSRITEAAHFPSDVWLGSALGYTIAKYQTLKPR